MTEIMGILNVTDDSFHPGSRVPTVEAALERGLQMVEDGADWLDIGGESTSHFRKGSSNADAHRVTAEEEMQRVLPVIRELRNCSDVKISIDTMKPEVARAAVQAGASMINDVSGLSDPEMQRIAAESDVDVCAMHMRGTPRTMHQHMGYPDGVMQHVLSWSRQRVDELLEAGVAPGRIILDPGFGFAKSIEDDYACLRDLDQLRDLGFRVLIGLSRKSMMGRVLDKPSTELLGPTLALNAIGISGGADIIRVHDVAEHRDVVKIAQHLL